jgi:hypothetical protein
MAGFEGIRPRIVGTLRSHTAQRGDAGEKWLLEEMGFDATRPDWNPSEKGEKGRSKLRARIHGRQ